MMEEIAKAVALLRHQIISPVLMESNRNQKLYFETLKGKLFDVPGKGPRNFMPSTMRGWLKNYKKKGFNGLVPKTRQDRGHFRRLSDEEKEVLKKFREDNRDVSITNFYDMALKADILGKRPICMGTLRRFITAHKLGPVRTQKPRKRFEMRFFGEMWTGDFMHGPYVLENPKGKKRRKAILMAFIDDHTRMIVGFRFGFFENSMLLEEVFKEAILQYGLPNKVYLDNGSVFSSSHTQMICANLNMALVHSKPYDSPSRGKIERFFRTVREGFLVEYKNNPNILLDDLNRGLEQWVQKYHHKEHRGINMRPIDRYNTCLQQGYVRRRVSEEEIGEYFLVQDQRNVRKDSTVHFNGKIYEAPTQLIGKRIDLRYALCDPSEIFIYEHGARIGKLTLCDAQLNGQQYSPLPKEDYTPYKEIESCWKPTSDSNEFPSNER